MINKQNQAKVEYIVLQKKTKQQKLDEALAKLDAKMFLSDLAREALKRTDVIEPGATINQFGDKIVFDPKSKKVTVCCREYPAEEVTFTKQSLELLCGIRL